jgi:hypothetical protein
MNHDELHDLLTRATDAIESPRLGSGALRAAGARRTGRRRSIVVSVGAALAVAAVVAAVTGPLASQRENGNPAAPSTDTAPTAGGLARWVAGLPEGDPPEVPYLKGMTLHLPDGSAVEIPGEDAAIVGITVKGPVVLVEDTRSGQFTSRYLVVHTTTGRHDEIPRSILGGYVQDEVTSPDGRLFIAGSNVIDLQNSNVVAVLPAHAAVLLSWTDAGVQYADKAGRQWLWEPRSEPWQLKEPTWFPSQLDPTEVGNKNDAVGLATSEGCTEVVHVYRGSQHDERWGRRCQGPAAVTMSPEGSWLLTRDLGVVDAVNMTTLPLATPTPGELPPDTGAYWTSDSVVLLALPWGVVRCDVITRDCERATDGLVALP